MFSNSPDTTITTSTSGSNNAGIGMGIAKKKVAPVRIPESRFEPHQNVLYTIPGFRAHTKAFDSLSQQKTIVCCGSDAPEVIRQHSGGMMLCMYVCMYKYKVCLVCIPSRCMYVCMYACIISRPTICIYTIFRFEKCYHHHYYYYYYYVCMCVGDHTLTITSFSAADCLMLSLVLKNNFCTVKQVCVLCVFVC